MSLRVSGASEATSSCKGIASLGFDTAAETGKFAKTDGFPPPTRPTSPLKTKVSSSWFNF
jgi:hypothetical protein